jgi:hypothetical protein
MHSSKSKTLRSQSKQHKTQTKTQKQKHNQKAIKWRYYIHTYDCLSHTHAAHTYLHQATTNINWVLRKQENANENKKTKQNETGKKKTARTKQIHTKNKAHSIITL